MVNIREKMATTGSDNGNHKPSMRPSRVSLTRAAAMAGYVYACEFCEVRFQTMKHLKEHREKCNVSQTPKEEKDAYVCEFCNREFPYGAFAKSHMRFCNSKAPKESNSCQFCNEPVKLSSKAHHEKNCPARMNIIIYTCSYCGGKWKNERDFQSHSRECVAFKALEHSPRQVLYKCKACAKVFQGKDFYLKHAQSCPAVKRSGASPVVKAATPVTPSNRVPVKIATPPDTSASSPNTPLPNLTRKVPHTIKKNSDGSMVIVIGPDEIQRKRNASPVPVTAIKKFKSETELDDGRSIVIDLRGKKLNTDCEEPPKAVTPKPVKKVKVFDCPYICEFCKVPYESPHLLKRHKKACYLGKQRYSLNCSFCELVFADLSSRTQHEKICTSKTSQNWSEENFDAEPSQKWDEELTVESKNTAANIEILEERDGTIVVTPQLGVSPKMSRREAMVAEAARAQTSAPPVSKPAVKVPKARKPAVAEAYDEQDQSESAPDQAYEEELGQHELEEEGDEDIEEEMTEDAEKENEDYDSTDESTAEALTTTKAKSSDKVIYRGHNFSMKCEICGMDGFQHESSLNMHQRFCNWVTNQKVKVKDSKTRSRELSIAASTSQSLFNDDDKRTFKSSVVKAQVSDKTSIDCDVSISDYESEDEVIHEVMSVDGTVDSDDETSQRGRLNRKKTLSQRKVRDDTAGGSGKFSKVTSGGKSTGDKKVRADSKDSSSSRSRSRSSSRLSTASMKIPTPPKEQKKSNQTETKCNCGERFGTKQALQSHMQKCTVGKGSQKKVVLCSRCNKKVDKSKLASHFTDCLKTCQHCKIVFGSTNAVNAHQRACVLKLANENIKDHKRKDTNHNVSNKAPKTASDIQKSEKVGKSGNIKDKSKVYKSGKADAGKPEMADADKKLNKSKGNTAKKLRCPLCKSVFNQAGALGMHKRSCSGLSSDTEKRTCIYCKGVFASRDSTRKHQKRCSTSHLLAKTKKLLKQKQVTKKTCAKCKRHFVNAGSLAWHKYHCQGKAVVRKAILKGKPNIVKCIRCNRKFGNVGALGIHKKFCKGPITQAKAGTKDSSKNSKFYCDYCNKECLSQQSLAGHIGYCKYKNGEKPLDMPYKCRKCQKGFLTTQLLASHIRYHQCDKMDCEKSETDQPFCCSYCGKGFSSSQALTSHTKSCSVQKSHGNSKSKTAQRDYQCQKCKFKFESANLMSLHLRTCKGIAVLKFSCKYCSSKLKNAKTYAAHVKMCKAKKGQNLPFICKICNGRYASSQSLAGHVRACRETYGVVDTDKKISYQFKCQFCDMKTKTAGGLKSHMLYFCKKRKGKKVKKIIQLDGINQEGQGSQANQMSPGKAAKPCDYCGKVFGNPGALSIHIKYCKLKPKEGTQAYLNLMNSDPKKKLSLIQNASQEFNDVHVVYVFLCPECGVKFESKAELLSHFVECTAIGGDSSPKEDQVEPQPGTSGVKTNPQPEVIHVKQDDSEDETVEVLPSHAPAEPSDDHIHGCKSKKSREGLKAKSSAKKPIPMPCEQCGWNYKSAKDADIINHKKFCIGKRSRSSVSSDEQAFKCELCGLEFKTEGRLEVHAKFCRWVVNQKVISNLPDETKPKPAAPAKPKVSPVQQSRNVVLPYRESVQEGEEGKEVIVYKCEYCFRTSSNKAALINHVRYCFHRPKDPTPGQKDKDIATTVIDISHFKNSL